MPRQMLELRNDFHGTTCQVSVGANGTLTKRQAKTAWRTLCGIEGCTCGDDFGARGPQIDKYGQRVTIIPVTPDEYELVVTEPVDAKREREVKLPTLNAKTRFNEREYERVMHYAKVYGYSIAEYCRRAALRELPKLAEGELD